MAPTLEQVFTMRLDRSKLDTLVFGPTHGSAPRAIAPLTGGHLRSLKGIPSSLIPSSINATFVPGGSDWLRVDPNTNSGHLDARVQFREEQAGAMFYIRFEGLVRMDEEISKVVNWDPQGKTSTSAEHYHFSNPIFEVSREQDKWMEDTAWVGHGHYVVDKDERGEIRGQAVEYEIYRLVTG